MFIEFSAGHPTQMHSTITFDDPYQRLPPLLAFRIDHIFGMQQPIQDVSHRSILHQTDAEHHLHHALLPFPPILPCFRALEMALTLTIIKTSAKSIHATKRMPKEKAFLRKIHHAQRKEVKRNVSKRKLFSNK
jgi:hypothetical protein